MWEKLQYMKVSPVSINDTTVLTEITASEIKHPEDMIMLNNHIIQDDIIQDWINMSIELTFVEFNHKNFYNLIISIAQSTISATVNNIVKKVDGKNIYYEASGRPYKYGNGKLVSHLLTIKNGVRYHKCKFVFKNMSN